MKMLFILLLLCILPIAYAEISETIINEDNTAYVEATSTLITIDKFEAKSNEEITLNIESDLEINKFCFYFDVPLSEIEIKQIAKAVPLWFDTNLKSSEIIEDNKICYETTLTNDEIYFEIEYKGYNTQKTKYNISFNDNVILDPYIVGSLEYSNLLSFRMPFNGNANIIWSSRPIPLTASNTRINNSKYDISVAGDETDESFATGGSYSVDYYVQKKAADTAMIFEAKYKTDNGLWGASGCVVGDTYSNYTVSGGCFNTYSDKVHFYVYSATGTSYGFYFYCENAGVYELMGSCVVGAPNPSAGTFYESRAHITNQSLTTSYNTTIPITNYINTLNLKSAYLFDLNSDSYDFKNLTNTAVAYNGAYYNTDGLVLDGINDFVNTTRNLSSIVGLNTNWTIFVKFTPQSASFGNQHLISDRQYSDPAQVFDMSFSGNYPWFAIKNESTMVAFTSSHAITSQITHTIAFTKNGNNYSMWQDGNFETSIIFNNFTNGGTQQMLIGQIQGVQYFNGTINKILFYNRSLSANEILRLNNSGNYTANIRGEANKAIELNGNEVFAISNNSFSTYSAYSICAWIKTYSQSNSPIYFSLANGNDYYQILGGKPFAAQGSLYGQIVNNNAWNHICFIEDGTTKKVYINGLLRNSTGNTATLNATTPFFIGDYVLQYSELGYGFNGSIDEFMLFSYALSNSEVKQLFGGYNSSINITFKDQNDNSALNQPVTLDIISENYSSQYLGVIGNQLVNGLYDEFVTIRHKAIGYTERLYYVNISNYSHTNITVYEISDNNSTEISFSVFDNTRDAVPNAYVYMLCYFLDTNSYEVVEMAKTNNFGVATLHAVLNDEFCKFSVYYPFGNLVYTTEADYIRTTTPYVQIDLVDTIGESFDQANNIASTISFNNATNNFRVDYSSSNGRPEVIRLDIYQTNNGVKSLINSSSVTSAAATLLGSIGTPTNGSQYEAVAYAIIDGKDVPIQTDAISYDYVNPYNYMGLFIVLALTILAAFIGYFSIIAAVILASLTHIVAVVAKILPLNMLPISIALFFLGIIVAILLSKEAQ